MTLKTKIAMLFMKITEKRILRERMNTMVKLMQNKEDSQNFNDILENMGRECCNKYKTSDKAKKYADDPKFFLDNITKFTIWDESADYDVEKGKIKVIGIKRSACICPFAKVSGLESQICDTCCVGFQKELFESLLNNPVNISIDESVLKGNNRCSVTVDIIN
ncbi:MAG: hypothetical protein GY870_21395 [archaeon]|nr:hypothetical protein [archaeon]